MTEGSVIFTEKNGFFDFGLAPSAQNDRMNIWRKEKWQNSCEVKKLTKHWWLRCRPVPLP